MNVLSIRNRILPFFAFVAMCGTLHLNTSAEQIVLKRMPGDRLDVSMQNEAIHSVMSGQEWLIAQQNPDGSWGAGTNQIFDTMLCLFTLRALNTEESEKALAKGADFLKTRTEPFPAFPFGCRIDLPLPKIAESWPLSAAASAKTMLEIAYSINRAGGVLLDAKKQPIDWRRDFGQRLIDTQKVSPRGGGFWRPAPGSSLSALAETAYSLLTFVEL